MIAAHGVTLDDSSIIADLRSAFESMELPLELEDPEFMAVSDNLRFSSDLIQFSFDALRFRFEDFGVLLFSHL